MLPLSFRILLRRLGSRSDLSSWHDHLKVMFAVMRFEKLMRSLDTPSPVGKGEMTAIVLSYKRPQNMDAIVRSLLATPSVGTVIVSNNNPEISIEKWIMIQDSRLRILNQKEHRCTPERMHIASRCPGELFLTVDDDLFLRPDQYEIVCTALRSDPTRVHGMFGTDCTSDGSFLTIRTGDRDVDILNRIYGFSQTHVSAFAALVKSLRSSGISVPENDNTWDDIILSFSGTGRPRSHHIGCYLDCPTQGTRHIAVWREDGFFEKRRKLYGTLLGMDMRQVHRNA